jgi:hypothetical protein
LQRVVNARVPHVFVTNNGQQDEIARSARLQRVLDLPVDPARMILCQTPLKVCNPKVEGYGLPRHAQCMKTWLSKPFDIGRSWRGTVP